MARNDINIGVIGFGTIGSGVVRLLQGNASILRQKLGFGLNLKKIADVDLKTKREVEVDRQILTSRAQDILDDPHIDVVVELIGGIEPARSFILGAIRKGKSVVTANKALLAESGEEIFSEGEKQRVSLGFEASVGGGIPILRAIRESYAGDRIRSILGIINGTSNYILSKMTDEGGQFDRVLSQAQKKGYAEADPTFDIDGIDAQHKLAILVSLGFGVKVDINQIYTEGIRHISPLDIDFAREFGYRIKLLAIAKDRGRKGIEARIHPTFLQVDSLLADVKGVFNAIYIVGEALGPNLLYGRGAGMMPTATAVLADIVAVSRSIRAEAGVLTPARSFPENRIKGARILDINELTMPYYLRFSVVDKPGVLSKISGILGKNNISIASMLQKGRMVGSKVPIFILTHEAKERNLRKAVTEIDRLDVVREPTRLIRIENKLE